MRKSTEQVIVAATTGDDSVAADVVDTMLELARRNPPAETLALIRDILDGKRVPVGDGGEKPERLLTVKQTAARLGRSRKAAQRLCARYGVAGIKSGEHEVRVRVYLESDVDRLVEALARKRKEVGNG